MTYHSRPELGNFKYIQVRVIRGDLVTKAPTRKEARGSSTQDGLGEKGVLQKGKSNASGMFL